jgi:hypothetical protein
MSLRWGFVFERLYMYLCTHHVMEMKRQLICEIQGKN